LTAVGRAAASVAQIASDRRSPSRCIFGIAGFGRQHHAISGGDADGRRAAHHHVADRLSHLLRAQSTADSVSRRQQPLIQQFKGIFAPDNSAHCDHAKGILGMFQSDPVTGRNSMGGHANEFLKGELANQSLR
jgi:hypothetical protein